MRPSIPIHYFPRHRRMARTARRIAKDAAFIVAAGVLLMLVASLGSVS